MAIKPSPKAHGCGANRVSAVSDVLTALDEYHRCYEGRDVEGVTNLCLWPFLAIREGTPIHLPDRDAVREHFAAAMMSYRVTGFTKWTAVEKDVHALGEHSVYLTVHWVAAHAKGQLLRDTWTSYQLLTTADGWRFLSYTNHF
jgi:SnoaL-like domain